MSSISTVEYQNDPLVIRGRLSDDLEVKSVSFVDGLLVVELNKYIPEHQRKIVYDISGEKELLLE